jgi:NTE family protein
VFYEERLLADGGLSNPVPVDIVKKMGADIVIAVNLDNVYVEKAFEKIPPLSKVPMHSINILRHNLALHSAKSADIVISPKDILQVGLLGWSHFFITEKAQTIIKAGADEANDAIPLIQDLIAVKLREQTRKGKFVSFLRRIQNF